ncbi:MAG TPA: S24/S26 family peptidase [Vicinamibacteria bacterium]|nr:S24/S26 family peptidase [Vicinamibacteria bacterium]
MAPLLEGLLRDGRSVSFRVDGHSMTPFIRRGDLVTVRPRLGDRPSLGDVLLVVADGHRLTVHRHVDWADGRVVPRGDAAPAPDPAVPLDRALGVVARVERRGRLVRVGLGPERRVVAWLSRIGLLARLALLHARLGRSAGPRLTRRG